MATVKYTGRADVRTLDADAMSKLGVEGFRKTRFPRNEAVEVSEEAAGVLVNKLGFELITSEEEQAEESDEAAKVEEPGVADKMSVEAANEAGARDTRSGGPVTEGTGGTGSTTGTTTGTASRRGSARGSSTGTAR